jgi:transcription initiation factor TFIIE subunit alpha
MDTAQLLVRSVMRAFYDTRSILIIEALMMHSAYGTHMLEQWITQSDADRLYSLRDDDLAYLMGMNTKDIHKLCAKLKEDRFLVMYV